MAVVLKNTKAKLQMTDYNGKSLCTYNKVNPNVSVSAINMFVDGINSLRKDTVGYTYLITESELVEDETEA